MACIALCSMASAAPAAPFHGARALLDLCERVYDSFNAAQHTLDTHLHNSLQQQAHRLTEDETCFVQEVGG